MNHRIFFDSAAPGFVFGMIAGGIAVLCLVTLLIALIETVVLTLIGWGDFRKSLGISLIMNIASGIVGGALLVIFPNPSIQSLIIAMVITILIEGGIMTRFQRGVPLTLLAVFLANSISYVIIIFPAFYYSQQ